MLENYSSSNSNINAFANHIDSKQATNQTITSNAQTAEHSNTCTPMGCNNCIKGGIPLKKEWMSLFVIALLISTTILSVLFINAKREIWQIKNNQVAQDSYTTKSETKKSYSLPKTKTILSYVALPEAKKVGKMSVEQAIQERRSKREFTEKPVSLAELSQVLWSAQGITKKSTTDAPHKRTAPSARETYPYTLYVVVRNVVGLEQGLYVYDPVENKLGNLGMANAGDMLNSANVQPNSQTAPAVIVMSAAYGKVVEKFPNNLESVTLLEGGHIGQNIYLQIESLGMGTVVTAGFDVNKVREALQLDQAETPVYLVPFGHPKAETTMIESQKAKIETKEAQTPQSAFFKIDNTVKLAQVKTFTKDELQKYDGKNGAKAYFAFKGKVYDVTASSLWKEGNHYGLQAGTDLTDKLEGAPHGEEVLNGFAVVGSFNSDEIIVENAKVDVEKKEEINNDSTELPTSSEPFYTKKIKIFGMSILGFTGVLLGIFFVFTFATCFAMPWAKVPLPWKGSRIGTDPLDNASAHLTWSSIHKHFVWITVIVGIIHGVIGFLQMLGFYI